jgi:hypothetical protein
VTDVPTDPTPGRDDRVPGLPFDRPDGPDGPDGGMLRTWYRAFGPTFDASLAYEFLGFAGAVAAEGAASHREKRAPRFHGPAAE